MKLSELGKEMQITFEIDNDGDCGECGQYSWRYDCADWEDIPTYTCIIFNQELSYHSSESRQSWICEQCEDCKEYLEKAKKRRK